MNNQELKKIIPTSALKISLDHDIRYHDVDIKLGKGSNKKVIFYNLRSDKTSVDNFKERISIEDPACLVLNNEPPIDLKCNYIVLDDKGFIELQANICDLMYPIPEGKILSGVTGTNGKTTTVALAMQLAHQNNLNAFSIGSLGICNIKKRLVDLKGMTTPPLIELRKYLHEYFREHDIAFMEVSSHGIDQNRIYGLEFFNGGWTSFSQDHLDYHSSLEDYFETKLKFLKNYISPKGRFFLPHANEELQGQLSSYNFIKTTSLSSRSIERLPDFFKPKFNQNDLELAIDLVEDILQKPVKVDIDKLVPPEGRFEVYTINGLTAIIDSAHTPQAFTNILKSIKQNYANKKVFVLFGCGGDRDSSKRQIMGQVAAKYADKLFITSDNPRTENPEQILDQITEGLKAGFVREVTREKAVEKAVSEMQDDCILVMLGKGPETYQIIGDKKHEYNDFKTFLKYAGQK